MLRFFKRIRVPVFVGMLFSLVLIVDSFAAAQTPNDYLIVPGERVGFITKDTTETEIKNRLSPQEYQYRIIDTGEGLGRRGLVLYPGTNREIAILWESDKKEIDDSDRSKAWKKSVILKDPEYVIIESSKWHTPEGIKVGTTLKELQRINGRPFTFAGFGWDYGGRLHSWEDGKISSFLVVDLKPEEEEYPRSLIGDQEIHSDSADANTAKIKVDAIRAMIAHE